MARKNRFEVLGKGAKGFRGAADAEVSILPKLLLGMLIDAGGRREKDRCNLRRTRECNLMPIRSTSMR